MFFIHRSFFIISLTLEAGPCPVFFLASQGQEVKGRLGGPLYVCLHLCCLSPNLFLRSQEVDESIRLVFFRCMNRCVSRYVSNFYDSIPYFMVWVLVWFCFCVFTALPPRFFRLEKGWRVDRSWTQINVVPPSFQVYTSDQSIFFFFTTLELNPHETWTKYQMYDVPKASVYNAVHTFSCHTGSLYGNPWHSVYLCRTKVRRWYTLMDSAW